MTGAWLPADDAHPPRPDWPIVRHFTFTEAHAIELGVGLGVLVVWGAMIGAQTAIVPVVVLAARIVLGKRRAGGGGTPADHTLGVHDIRQEPPYFVVATLATAALLLAADWGWGWGFTHLPV